MSSEGDIDCLHGSSSYSPSLPRPPWFFLRTHRGPGLPGQVVSGDAPCSLRCLPRVGRPLPPQRRRCHPPWVVTPSTVAGLQEVHGLYTDVTRTVWIPTDVGPRGRGDRQLTDSGVLLRRGVGRHRRGQRRLSSWARPLLGDTAFVPSGRRERGDALLSLLCDPSHGHT